MSDPESKLICIEYPGDVQNVDKMVETLGGSDNVNEVFSQPNRKLELRFRPNAIGCKPTCGEPMASESNKSILIKAKLLKNVKTGQTKIVHEIIGPIDTIYNFQGLCDFQYLPMAHEGNGVYSDISEKVAPPHVLETKDELMEKNDNIPLYLPPLAFSRTDTPQDYNFRREVRDEKIAHKLPEHIIGRNREKRSNFNVFLTFDAEKVPEKPHDGAVKALGSHLINIQMVNQIKSMFQEHPVWLRSELLHKSKISDKQLKMILPVVAYYFSNGPWRNQWVRMGYDPRRDVSASKYQTLDYRIRIHGGTRKLVQNKRKSSILNPYKTVIPSSNKPKTSVIDLSDSTTKEQSLEEMNEQEEKLKDAYLFRPGRIPPFRQMFYQFRNIEIPELDLLMDKHKGETDKECDEKHGWFTPGLDAIVR